MKKIKILVTGGGSPGIAGTIYSLRNNYDNRDVEIITTDAKAVVPGKYLADKFYMIPKASAQDQYLKVLAGICENEVIDVILPQNTSELLVLAQNKHLFLNLGTQVVVSDYQGLLIANNKYDLLKVCKNIGVPFPEYYLTSNFNNLKNAATKLGWPEKPVVVKPPDSNGSRGLRIIDEKKDYKDLFYNEKPTALFSKLSVLRDMIGESFPALIIMEYLPGKEVSIDIFRDKQTFISIPRIREEIRSGISFQNSAVNDSELHKYSRQISDHLNLSYCFGFQFKEDINGIPRILECNPRVQGTMIFSTFMGANLIYSAVKSALGERVPPFNMDWNTKLLRYWGALGLKNKEEAIRV